MEIGKNDIDDGACEVVVKDLLLRKNNLHFQSNGICDILLTTFMFVLMYGYLHIGL
jgi:hypothetical protein